ncbi:MAG: hypothetical protein IKY61_09385, partial [Thermoguttaceae bacterium]|nr:hypothetical protein [Thermoguttaceae bacterium]
MFGFRFAFRRVGFRFAFRNGDLRGVGLRSFGFGIFNGDRRRSVILRETRNDVVRSESERRREKRRRQPDRKTIVDFEVRELLEPIFAGGKCVFEKKSINEIRDYCKEQVDTLWDEVTRFENPHNYYVDLSQPLWDLKQSLLRK